VGPTAEHSAPVRLHHEVTGRPDAPAVLLAPSLGTTLGMWDGLADDLARSFRVVRVDTRGHGRSPVPPGPYDVDGLAADVLATADDLGLRRFAFVGLSLGGAIGQALAATYPDRVDALVLCCTGPSFGDPQQWHDRAARVRADGMGWLTEPTRERWFTAETQRARPRTCERLLAMLTSTPPEGYAACCGALATFDMTPRLGAITAPTRVVVGAEDPVSPPEVGQQLAAGIDSADLVVLDGASHLAVADRPEQVNATVREHLEKHL
jgi:3-oxoadipate enol-lactonase